MASDGRTRWYHGTLWYGMSVRAWVRLLVRNRFAVSPSRLFSATAISAFALANSALGIVQTLALGRRINRVQLPEDPLFVIGHWRSGTTMLHELLSLDPRHTAPNTFQSLSPHHFVLTEQVLTRVLRFLLPRTRPVDNVPLGWQRPQEDEVALCNLGASSPFLSVAFPNRPPQNPEYITLETLPKPRRDAWIRIWQRFLRQVLLVRPGVLVLKSPQHSFRLPLIEGVFPKARYVHVVRDPFVVFSSTVHFWKSWHLAYGLQVPRDEGIEETVFATFTEMHEKIESDRRQIDPSRWLDIRYEDLVADPIGVLRQVYATLNLGDFSVAEPHMQCWLKEQTGYQTNRYRLPSALRDEIARRWAPQVEQFRALGSSPVRGDSRG